MSIRGYGRELRTGKIVLPYSAASFTLTEGTPNLITTLGAGTPAIKEMAAASEQAGIGLDDNDEVYWKIPFSAYPDFDPDYSIRPEVVFYDTTAHTGIIFALHVKGVAAGEAVGDCKSSADGTYQWPAFASGGTDVLNALPLADLGVKGKFGSGGSVSDKILMVALTLVNKGTASADNIVLDHVALHYTRNEFSPSGMHETT